MTQGKPKLFIGCNAYTFFLLLENGNEVKTEFAYSPWLRFGLSKMFFWADNLFCSVKKINGVKSDYSAKTNNHKQLF